MSRLGAQLRAHDKYVESVRARAEEIRAKEGDEAASKYLEDEAKKDLNMWKSVFAGAAAGAVAGSVIPVIGTGLGAMIGMWTAFGKNIYDQFNEHEPK